MFNKRILCCCAIFSFLSVQTCVAASQNATDSKMNTTSRQSGGVPKNSDSAPLHELSPRQALMLSLAPSAGSILVASAFWAIGYASNGFHRSLPIVGTGILVLGLSVGPSIGHFYSGRVVYGVGASIGRMLGFAAASGLFIEAIISEFEEHDKNYGNEQYAEKTKGPKYMIAAAFILTAGCLFWAVFDIVTAPRAARRENERRRKLRVVLAPTVLSDYANRKRTGIAILGQF
jgi:hypothetical protein